MNKDSENIELTQEVLSLSYPNHTREIIGNGNSVERIGKGGEGGEANIYIELRSKFPGIGGIIRTSQAIAVAYREEHTVSSKTSDRLFLKHTLIKKLEDYFFTRGVYKYAHITRPLGALPGGYIYEWAFGSDLFPWYYVDTEGNWIDVTLDDWSQFIGAFNEAGINLQSDCTDPDDGRISQNIVHQYPQGVGALNHKMNRLWKRIDFGDRSIRIDRHKLLNYLIENEKDILRHLTIGRYELMVLTCEYLINDLGMTQRDLGKLEILVRDYRCSTLSHLNTRGI